ncbi:esterase/lipase family protein [Gilvimarinus agarilyticus]|uniref:esterase/lipase family protein n=1 Tax=Gilvimarinus agarilyticus TaxID=679259 RepID=UPI00069728CE|nr:hypothetical protein [Gilvimarinus agarilyticus]
MKPLVIIHGWNDEAKSFTALADALRQHTGRKVKHIWLGNYTSLDDDVHISDLGAALTRAWAASQLPDKPKSVDVIVHSTGGLILRYWMAQHYTAAGLASPVNNLVMLAPANFGSPLAHKGRAFYGRVLKGFGSDKPLETGEHILKALEVASPFSWQLAEADLLGQSVFTPTRVRTTVIIGNSGYDGISSIANERGSDGTIYLAAANLNCAKIEADFASDPQKPTLHSSQTPERECAFLALDKHDHSSIALKDFHHKGNAELIDAIAQALAISNGNDYQSWVDQCRARTKALMQSYAKRRDDYKHGYQNTVFRVRDDQGNEVCDYVIEFYQKSQRGVLNKKTRELNAKAIAKVHAYKDNPSYRSFMINCTLLHTLIDEKGENLRISLSAIPDLHHEKTLAGYWSFQDKDIGHLELNHETIKTLFVANRTLLINITLKRENKQELLMLHGADHW